MIMANSLKSKQMVVFKQQAPVDIYLLHACPLAEERWTKYLERGNFEEFISPGGSSYSCMLPGYKYITKTTNIIFCKGFCPIRSMYENTHRLAKYGHILEQCAAK
jgi:hypothetical protein